MYRLVKIRELSENVKEYVIDAPKVAKKAQPGQFIILRVSEEGERVPFTICDFDREAGTVTILVQTVGATTMKLAAMKEGDCLQDFAGPLGNPTDLSAYKNILLVGGGVGSAVIFPQAKELKRKGQACDVIVGARNRSLIIYEKEFAENSRNLYVMTDDGSYGEKGFVTTKLQQLIDAGTQYDAVFAVGPLVMMKAVCNVTRQYGIKTIVSMNSIMVDGTGMCGCCRLTVDGKTYYACVDGPEFDGFGVDFDEAINRSKYYKEIEAEHVCFLRGEK